MGVMDRRTLVKEGKHEVHEGILWQTKELEYSLSAFEEMIKWEHFMLRVMQGHSLMFMYMQGTLMGIGRLRKKRGINGEKP